MILLSYFLALVIVKVQAVPATPPSEQLATINLTHSVSDSALSSLRTNYTIDARQSVSSTSFLINTEAPHFTPFDGSSSIAISVSLSLADILPSSAPPPMILTKDTTTFEATITSPSSTVLTFIITTTATPSAIAETLSSSWETRTLWAAPPQMTDLSAFNITHFPSGHRNLRIVTRIPEKAIGPSAKLHQSQSPFPSANSNASALLQLAYPAESVNPGSKPQGGADFYATPLNLSGARNVTLTYSVFFPVDFDWVKGGKLPGLFGGHMGCSGGASADDCFSTRLMWRSQGVGELYLYAPKDKQTETLCADVTSVCDAAYGFSVGRGAFHFTAGDWTQLEQNVVLNTPGRNDGWFTLFVDGRQIISRSDIFYRGVARQDMLNAKSPSVILAPPNANFSDTAVRTTIDRSEQPVEFIGLFFSTFFGGHGKSYATPRRQYTWFKDFAIFRHD